MNNRARRTAYAAVLGAMYAALTYLQNLLLPGSATWAIQVRAAEALCVLALFTPAAAPGLAVGCFVFNLQYAGALPLDFLVGPLATWLACRGMEKLSRHPWAALALPAVCNGLLVGWELTVYVGGAFGLNCLYVALGELAAMYTLGAAVYALVKKTPPLRRLFGETAC